MIEFELFDLFKIDFIDLIGSGIVGLLFLVLVKVVSTCKKKKSLRKMKSRLSMSDDIIEKKLTTDVERYRFIDHEDGNKRVGINIIIRKNSDVNLNQEMIRVTRQDVGRKIFERPTLEIRIPRDKELVIGIRVFFISTDIEKIYLPNHESEYSVSVEREIKFENCEDSNMWDKIKNDNTLTDFQVTDVLEIRRESSTTSRNIEIVGYISKESCPINYVEESVECFIKKNKDKNNKSSMLLSGVCKRIKNK